jgi:hypothetical protein
MSSRASTSDLIDRIKETITERPLRGCIANGKALEALEAARLANQRRNRVIHDQWIAIFDDDGPRLEHIRTNRPTDNISPTRETLDAISSVSRELTAAYYRIFGILLFAKQSDGLTPSEVENECGTALSLMSGLNKIKERHQ